MACRLIILGEKRVVYDRKASGFDQHAHSRDVNWRAKRQQTGALLQGLADTVGGHDPPCKAQPTINAANRRAVVLMDTITLLQSVTHTQLLF